jgi:hypothetical protein
LALFFDLLVEANKSWAKMRLSWLSSFRERLSNTTANRRERIRMMLAQRGEFCAARFSARPCRAPGCKLDYERARVALRVPMNSSWKQWQAVGKTGRETSC